MSFLSTKVQPIILRNNSLKPSQSHRNIPIFNDNFSKSHQSEKRQQQRKKTTQTKRTNNNKTKITKLEKIALSTLQNFFSKKVQKISIFFHWHPKAAKHTEPPGTEPTKLVNAFTIIEMVNNNQNIMVKITMMKNRKKVKGVPKKKLMGVPNQDRRTERTERKQQQVISVSLCPIIYINVQKAAADRGGRGEPPDAYAPTLSPSIFFAFFFALFLICQSFVLLLDFGSLKKFGGCGLSFL